MATKKGCTKHVKKAGMCSTHGPARKRCSIDGCGKVAVQGGKCVSHGAKKKSCSVDSCPKQATLFGMCKRHYDAVKGTLSDNGERERRYGRAPVMARLTSIYAFRYLLQPIKMSRPINAVYRFFMT